MLTTILNGILDVVGMLVFVAIALLLTLALGL